MFLLAPHSARANDDKPKHKNMNATEIAGIGVGAAALVGLAGYLFLRRRHSA
jgi:LPXTG-motif cell wall-anchored protein